MLGKILFVVAIALAAGSIPASAAKMSEEACRKLCLQNRCGHGAANQQMCMEHCVATCVKRHKR
jgi:hypothetical protein